MRNEVERLVITHKDRLWRFGAELVFALCEEFQTAVVMVNQSAEISDADELTQDVLEIITVFSARLYGSGSAPNSWTILNTPPVVKNFRGDGYHYHMFGKGWISTEWME